MKKRGICELKIRSRKSQITIFIILGIIIVISMGLLFAANIRDDFSATILENTAIKNNIISCLEEKTNKGLELIGKQGGVIERDTNNLEYKIDDKTYSVAYGIKKSDEDLYISYPYPGKLVKDPDKLAVKNYFGNYVTGFDDHLSFLTPLCSYKESSPNWAWNIVKKSCETYGFNGNSVQDYLQNYITEKMKKCEVKYPGYNIKLGEIKTEVLIGEDDLIINLEYPIEIFINGKTKTKLLEYSINPKVRLKKIHEFASHLIGYRNTGLGILPRGDVTDLFFNMLTDYKSLRLECREQDRITVSCWKDGMKIEKLYNIQGADDIFRIIDEKSLVNNKPFIFQFAIENRRPVLDYIDKVKVGDEITVKAYDPDDGDALKLYINNVKEAESNDIINFEYKVKDNELIAEVCDNANFCDSQIVEIIQ